jgi:hypothetical protein
MSSSNPIIVVLEAIAETAGEIGDAVQVDVKIDIPVQNPKEED